MKQLPLIVYLHRDRLYVCGYPAHDAPALDEDSHNCDSMGCPSAGAHTMAVIALSAEDARTLRAFAPEEPTE